MSETTPEQAGKYDPEALELGDAPADVPEAESVGHAVYDLVKRQYIGPVERDTKPTAKQAKELAGHDHVAVVRV